MSCIRVISDPFWAIFELVELIGEPVWLMDLSEVDLVLILVQCCACFNAVHRIQATHQPVLPGATRDGQY